MSNYTQTFEADTGKILNIVINSLYSERDIFLRELLSNASDAIQKRKFLGQTDPSILNNEADSIEIIINKKKKVIEITDTGIGLTEAELAETLGTIAKSGTSAFLKEMEGEGNSKDAAKTLIGQFGVGFYSAFMVADKVEVVSRKAGNTQCSSWESDGQSGFSISNSEEEQAVGTKIRLSLKRDAKEFSDPDKIKALIKKYSDHISFPINIKETDGEIEQVNSATAIWTKSASEISKEEYKEFYNSTFGAFDEPFATLHNKSEGTLEFTNLLFIPKTAPFDLFDPERKTKINLYINRVFISNDLDGVIPTWLRFIKGILDTTSLDLNVSREMLQHNPAVQKIGKAVVRRILTELKKKKDKDREAYDGFWEQFGIVLKEGLYEDANNREKLLDLCLFTSARSGAFISLADYLSAMPETQNNIYTLSAETLEQAQNSPHLEGFKARDIDVLLLTDPVDEFWLQSVTEFEGKPFASATRGAHDLDAVSQKEDAKDENSDDVAKDESFGSLLETFKTVLGEAVGGVRLSKTLTESPACLVADENGMDIQMERLMKAHNKDFVGAPRILEINPDHALVKGLKDTSDNALVSDAAHMLFDQAQILEGRTPVNLPEFAQRLTRLMERGLSV